MHHRGGLGRSSSLLLAAAGLVASIIGTTLGYAQASAPRPPVPGAPAGVAAFVNVNVVPMDTERVLPNQTVLVDGGWITALGPTTQVKVPATAVRIDGRDQYLVPGLADCHAHIGKAPSSLLGSAAVEHRLFLWVANGLTTVRNLDHSREPVSGREVLQLRTRAAAGELWSPRISTAGVLVDGLRERQGEGRELKLEEIAEAVAAYKAAGYDFIKVHNLYGFGAVFDSLAATARQAGLSLVGHAVVPLDRALTAYRSIEHLTGYFKFGWGEPLGALDRPESINDLPAYVRTLAEATQRAGVWNCPTQYNSTLNREPPEKLALRGQLIKALQAAGAGLLAGSDRLQYPNPIIYQETAGKISIERVFNGLMGDPEATHHELEALVQAGLTPYQALAAATRNMAAFTRTLDEVGTVVTGKRADLVLLRGNPLDDIRKTRRPAGVMLGGRWLPRAEIERRVAVIKTSLRPLCDSVAASRGQPPC